MAEDAPPKASVMDASILPTPAAVVVLADDVVVSVVSVTLTNGVESICRFTTRGK